MQDTEKEACLILEEAAATLSLAHNLVKKEKVKQMIPAVQNELIALRDVINTNTPCFDPVRVSELLSKIDIRTDSPQPLTRLAANVGSAALDLACANVRHAAGKIHLSHPWSVKKEFAFDSLNKLADVLYALARDEERSL